MSQEKKDKAPPLREFLTLRRAIVTLSPYVSNLELKYGDSLSVKGSCMIDKQTFFIEMKCDRMLKVLVQELLRLEPAMIGGKVDVSDIKALIVGLYAPASTLTKIRMRIKKHTGLFKDTHLRRRLVVQKIRSGEKYLSASGAKVKGSMG